jgi:hypothetical protein
MNYTIIEYTPSHANYYACDRAYYSYRESELNINTYDDYQEALNAVSRSDSDNEVTVLINGIPINDILNYSDDELLKEQATGLSLK